MSEVTVHQDALREEVRAKYREVAAQPDAEHHFHTGRRLAALLGYDEAVVAQLPDRAVESFAGVVTRSPRDRWSGANASSMSDRGPASTRSSPPSSWVIPARWWAST